jgi:hypothetical protein
MIPFQLYYGKAYDSSILLFNLFTQQYFIIIKIDVASCRIKYEEGFVQVNNSIVTRPEFLWSKEDRDLVIPTGKC